MECSLCNELYNLPTNNIRPNSKFTIILDDGKIVCNHCYDVLEWTKLCDISKDKSLINKPAETIIQTKQSQTTITTPISKPFIGNIAPNVVIITCPKCKFHFSGRFCSCGFKNPLFR